MTDDNTIGVGDICTYSYDNDNKSLSIVEVVEEFSDEVLVVKFLQVIVDDSGNGLFTYLHKTARTMNVSKKYLHKILLINRQKAEIERLQTDNSSMQSTLAKMSMGVEQAKAEAIKECLEWVFSLFPEDKNFTTISRFTVKQKLKEMVGDTE